MRDNDEHNNRFKNTTQIFFYKQTQPIRVGRRAMSYWTPSGLFSVIFTSGKKSARQKCRWLLDYYNRHFHPSITVVKSSNKISIFLNNCTSKLKIDKYPVAYVYVWMYWLSEELQVFWKCSLLLNTLYFIGTALSTVVNRYRFDSRGRS